MHHLQFRTKPAKTILMTRLTQKPESEKSVQRQVVAYINQVVRPRFPQLKTMACPQADHQGAHAAWRGKQAKELGYERGTPDLTIICPRIIPYLDYVRFCDSREHGGINEFPTSMGAKLSAIGFSGISLEIKRADTVVYNQDGSLRAGEQLALESEYLLAMQQAKFIPLFTCGYEATINAINWYFSIK